MVLDQPDSSNSGGPGSNPGENENYWKNFENYLRCDNSSIKGTLCSAKPGCRVAQVQVPEVPQVQVPEVPQVQVPEVPRSLGKRLESGKVNCNCAKSLD